MSTKFAPGKPGKPENLENLENLKTWKTWKTWKPGKPGNLEICTWFSLTFSICVCCTYQVN